jgi:prefoldin subunit 5
MSKKLRELLNERGPRDLELQNLVLKKETEELKNIITNKNEKIDELSKKINAKLDNLRKNGL